MLRLAECLVLLALDDEKGTVRGLDAGALDLGLAGALLAELDLQERIALTMRTVTVRDATSVGEPLLDETLALVAGNTRQRNAKGWVEEVAHRVKHVRERLCEGLVARGVLHREEHSTLLLFHRVHYPTGDPAPEEMLRAALQAAAAGQPPIEPRLLMLLSLARACDLLDGLAAKDARKAVAALINAEPWGEAVQSAMRSRRAALIAATSTFTAR